MIGIFDSGLGGLTILKSILKKYLRSLKEKQVQILIPACTHYPFLLKDIERIMTKKCKILNPGEVVAKSLADYLSRHPRLQIQPSKNSTIKFYTTDDVSKFKKLGEKFLEQKINKIEKISLLSSRVKSARPHCYGVA